MKTKNVNLNKQESFILYNSFYELYFEELTTEELECNTHNQEVLC